MKICIIIIIINLVRFFPNNQNVGTVWTVHALSDNALFRLVRDGVMSTKVLTRYMDNTLDKLSNGQKVPKYTNQ